MIAARFAPFATGIALLVPMTAFAQEPKPRVSPDARTSTMIDGNTVTLIYGRPYSKDPQGGKIRKIWGGLVPYGQPWRLGANEATLLLTQRPLVFGATTVPPGAYTLYMIPEENGGKLAINKNVGSPGVPIDEKQDLARVDLKREKLEPQIDQLTMAVELNPPAGGTIKIMWEGATYSVPFTVMKAPEKKQTDKDAGKKP